MKRLFSLLLITILIFSLIGCKEVVSKDQNNLGSNEEQISKDVLTIADYYPFNENTMMDYEGVGNEYAEQKVIMEFIEGDKAQIKIFNPGTFFVKVLENKNGELTEVFAEGEFYHIENMITANTNTNRIILKEPLELDTTWIRGEDQSTITALDKEIETPSGKYKTLEVTTEFTTGGTQKDYYAKGIGLVASISNFEGFEVKTLLSKIENQKQDIELYAYYPNAQDIGTVYTRETIEFGTNDSVEDILESIMKNPPSDKLLSAISKNTSINKIYLNRDSWTLEVDFSKELLSDMNAGSALEAEVLKSVVNTLGKYYDVEKVYLSIDGKPYESGHFGIRAGESFSVDNSDIEEFKK